MISVRDGYCDYSPSAKKKNTPLGTSTLRRI